MVNLIGEFAVMLFLSIYFVLPAYFGNGLAVVTGGGTPLDLKRNFIDGRRVFGDGKTIRGFIGGLIFGFIAGLIQMFAAPIINGIFQQLIIDFSLNPAIGVNAAIILFVSPLRAFLLPLGGLTGDLVGSFIKRRLNFERGRSAPFLDQLDFILFALLFGYFISPFSWEYVVILLVFTPIIHLIANIIAYGAKLKKEPW
jgi:CDP-2,3-bis-(O-geranylgeranyl)-sn-glycerol synthase